MHCKNDFLQAMLDQRDNYLKYSVKLS